MRKKEPNLIKKCPEESVMGTWNHWPASGSVFYFFSGDRTVKTMPCFGTKKIYILGHSFSETGAQDETRVSFSLIWHIAVLQSEASCLQQGSCSETEERPLCRSKSKGPLL